MNKQEYHKSNNPSFYNHVTTNPTMINIEDEMAEIDAILGGDGNIGQFKTKDDSRSWQQPVSTKDTFEQSNQHFYSIYNIKPNHNFLDSFLRNKKQNDNMFPPSLNQLENFDMNISGDKDSLYLSKVFEQMKALSEIPTLMKQNQAQVIEEINSNNYYISKLVSKIEQLLQILEKSLTNKTNLR